MDFWQHLGCELEAREAQSLRRRMRVLPPGLFDLASNDYLGLSRHPEVIAAAQHAAQNYGAGARASRLVSGDFELHHQLEEQLANFKNTEAALVFSSGYAANIGLITALADAQTTLFCHKRNHASLIDGCRLAEQGGAKIRFFETAEKLSVLLDQCGSPRKIIVADGVFSMDGDVLELPAILAIAQQFDTLLILDDAHGTGTLGVSGRGLTEHFGLHDDRIITVGTLSKALGSQGGFVVGPQVLIDWLVNSARSFIYSTGLNPAAVGAALKALEILQAEPERIELCRSNARFLATELQQLGFNARLYLTPIVPVLLGDEQKAVELSRQLEEWGLWCPAIRPPTVKISRLRLTASAAWTGSDKAKIVESWRKVAPEN